MPKRSSVTLLSAADLEGVTECRSYSSLAAFKQVRRLPTASSEYSLSYLEDGDDDDETSSVISSCGSSSSDMSLLSSASSRALPDEGDHREVSAKQTCSDALANSKNAAAAVSPVCAASIPTQVPYSPGLAELADFNIPTTHDLDEALRSNGLLAYVPPTCDSGLERTGEAAPLGVSTKAAKLLDSPPAAQPDKPIWALSGSMPSLLAGCPCPMCQDPGCMTPVPMSPTGLTSTFPVRQNCGAAVPLAPPASPGSCYSEECNFRGPIPSSLAIAAALAAGDLPLLSRPQQFDVPAVKGVLPMSYAAALLMASPGTLWGAQPGAICQTAIPLPSRPLNLPLSSPSLLAAPALPLGL